MDVPVNVQRNGGRVWLTSCGLDRLLDTAFSLGLADDSQRGLLVGRLPNALVGALPVHTSPDDQLQSDLQELNRQAREGATFGLLSWLECAIAKCKRRGTPVAQEGTKLLRQLHGELRAREPLHIEVTAVIRLDRCSHDINSEWIQVLLHDLLGSHASEVRVTKVVEGSTLLAITGSPDAILTLRNRLDTNTKTTTSLGLAEAVSQRVENDVLGVPAAVKLRRVTPSEVNGGNRGWVPVPSRPLQSLLAFEACLNWPDDLVEFRVAMRDYAARLRDDRAQKQVCAQELRLLLERELSGLLLCRDDVERQARRDAFNEFASDTDGFAETLELASARLSRKRVPNLVSFLRAKVIWRANDILESKTRRHNRLVQSLADLHASLGIEQRAVSTYPRAQRRVLGAFDDPVSRRLLAGLMEGESIAELARRTGTSRQQIYRFLQRLREWSEE